MCSTATDVATALQIDQSLSVSYGPDSVDEKTSFFQSLTVTTFSLHLVLYAQHGSVQTTVTAQPTSAGPSPTSVGAAAFVAAYGDSYVNSVTVGGEFYAVYSFYTETLEEQTNLATSIRAAGLYGGVQVSGDLSSNFSKFMKDQTVSWDYAARLGGVQDAIPEPDQAFDYALGFSGKTLDTPVLLSKTSQGYETIPAWYAALQPVVANRNYFLGPGGLVGNLQTLQEIADQAELISDIYSFYGYTADTGFAAKQKAVATDLTAIQKQIVAFAADATQTFTAPTLPSLANGTPTLQKTYTVVGPFGDTGGDPFDQVNQSNYVESKTRIASIQFRGGAAIDRITVSYANSEPKTSFSNQAGAWTDDQGGSNGSASQTLQLPSGVFVAQFYGYYYPAQSGSGGSGGFGQLLSAQNFQYAKITLSNGNSLQSSASAFPLNSGYGEGTKGTEVKWPTPPATSPPAGQIFCGFCGRSGARVDQLGFTYVQFGPALWSGQS
jgi:hypothetical protein